MKRYALALALVFLMAMSPMVASGSDDREYRVVVVAPETVQGRDAVLEVEVHVLWCCEYTDVPAEDIDVWISPGWHDGRPITVQEVRGGVYGASVQLADEDWSEYLTTKVRVELHNISSIDYIPEDSVDVRVRTPYSIHVELEDPSQVFIEPGETVDFEIHTMKGDQHVAPDASSLEVELMDDRYTPREDLATVTTEEAGAGHYLGSVVFVHDPEEAMSLELKVRTEFTEGDHTFVATGSHDLHLELFKVFCHFLGLTGEEVDLELVVVNTSLAPVPQASVDLRCTYYGAGMQRYDDIEGTTDGDGMLRSTVTWEHEEDDEASILMYGTVEKDGSTQKCSRSVLIREWREKSWPPTKGAGVEMVSVKPLVPGESSEVQARLLWDKEPLGGSPVNYVVLDPHGVYATGSTTTDAQGLFTLDVTVPEAVTGDYWWEEVALWVYSTAPGKEGMDTDPIRVERPLAGQAEHYDERMEMEIVEMVPGSHIVVEVKGDFIDPSEDSMRIECGFGAMRWDSRTVVDEWSLLSSGEWYLGLFLVEPASWEDGAYRARVPLPGFVGEGERVWLMAVLTDADDPEGDGAHMDYLEDVEVVKKGGSSVKDDGVPGASALATLAALLIAGTCKRRRLALGER